ncbi:MAG: hypothetical protein Q8N54_06495 [Sulfurimicrobium sp.]|nr:hypothetical protein [Sulfurimicrobium sp.]MDO9189460.1 hypothetical protein [Sulfurimicrobium sp.]MDP1704168.1 hypothetical protein [Sulfurimicrobium sp.]MDP2197726.1 hypothetical protein [Sulfurimicrobium sp.]MDP2962392.1 hypothetical protein [Sulfurimicrobium sp.]
MLNEDAYKATYDDKVRLSCPFEKAILSRCAECVHAQKLNIAEREAVACENPLARENCFTLHGLLHQNALFVLKQPHPDEPLPHAKEIKVQCGGLLGVLKLFCQEANKVDNIHAMVGKVQRRFSTMQNVPFQEVIKEIAAYEGRRKRR